MPLDPRLVGRTYPPGPPYEVGREKIREFADAIGDPHPAYRDPEAAKALGHADVIAPLTFPVVFTFRITDPLFTDPELALQLHRILHGEQRFRYVRPITAGDRLVCVLTIEAVKQSAAGMEVLAARSDIATTDGEPVCTAYATWFHRPEDAQPPGEATT